MGSVDENLIGIDINDYCMGGLLFVCLIELEVERLEDLIRFCNCLKFFRSKVLDVGWSAVMLAYDGRDEFVFDRP